MTSNPKPTGPLWHCVHDRQLREVYLGTDEAAAKRLVLEGCVIASGTTRGNAMRLAALANGIGSRRRPARPPTPK